MSDGARLSDIAEKLSLTNCTPEIDLSKRYVLLADINRPALQLEGFYDHFEEERIQLIGMVEYAYLHSKKTPEQRAEIYRTLFETGIPCIVMCRGLEPEEQFVSAAMEFQIPILMTGRDTSEFMAELIYTLSYELAPTTTLHGVLVDVYGEGLLITGESGIGKSEAALELVRRGHRLVADDVVEIRKINDNTLMGTASDVTRHLIELRGIGIIDAKSLFGVECVKDNQKIDFVIRLEDWKREREYDRLGLKDEYMDILGQQVTCYNLPIRPGRNLAVICETAAVNHRQKKMGYNAAEELYRRVTDNIAKGSEKNNN
ncbi:MAG: HPr(Ser) kinase/phosphatase [Lachnospiraceae bacterium]|nr:HPr(Ser) kinase/phosphatase [Lachnospiraceae bacterium]